MSPDAKPETPVSGEDLVGVTPASPLATAWLFPNFSSPQQLQMPSSWETHPTKGTSVNQGNLNTPFPRLTSGTAQTTSARWYLSRSQTFQARGQEIRQQESGSFLTFFRSSFPKIPVTEPISDPVTLANLIFLLSGGNSDSFYCIYLSQIYCTQMDDSGLCFLLRSIFILSHQEERYAGPEGCSAQPSDTSYFSLLKETAVVTEVLS